MGALLAAQGGDTAPPGSLPERSVASDPSDGASGLCLIRDGTAVHTKHMNKRKA
jgi:hypothetical protein